MGGKHRGFFKKELMQKEFGEIYEKRADKTMPKGGYPDCGNGLHSLKILDYGQWFQFNLAQRAAKNYMEQITLYIFSLLVLTVVFPSVAFYSGCVNLIARIGYAITY